MIVKILSTVVLFTVFNAVAANKSIESFSKAKKLLAQKVYYDHRVTLYCDAAFDEKKLIDVPKGYNSIKYVKRSKKVEWEHVVPAENFGRIFVEWRDGDSRCMTSKKKAYKGRKCANSLNQEYRLMQADMYNLFPAMGSVNAMRSNYNFTMLPSVKSDFGSCDMKIDNRKAEPPIAARGRIARAYLYMDESYKQYKMSSSQYKLMSAWDKLYPVSQWECTRASRIEKIQGSVNRILDERC